MSLIQINAEVVFSKCSILLHSNHCTWLMNGICGWLGFLLLVPISSSDYESKTRGFWSVLPVFGRSYQNLGQNCGLLLVLESKPY